MQKDHKKKNHEEKIHEEKIDKEEIHKEKKKNITPENIGGIILSQIPGISSKTSSAVIAKHGSLFQLLKTLEKDKHCLDNLLYKTKTGQERRISRTSIANIIQYLF